jgi:hypothetical protein
MRGDAERTAALDTAEAASRVILYDFKVSNFMSNGENKVFTIAELIIRRLFEKP